MVILKPNVVRGGRAIGLGNNFYLMKGRTHSKGGIDIGKNPKTGLEVENNEVMQVSPKGVRVFSAQPILGGISPAQYILGGANPNQVFNAQEQWKKINRINDDGTKKAQLGKELYKKKHNISLIDDRPESEAPLNYDEIKRRQEFMESEFNSKAYNKNSGAKGRFQIIENALQDYIRAGGEEGDLFDSNYNEKVRDWIMEDLSKSSMVIAGNPTDSVKMAKQLAAYNWGRGNLSKFLQKQKAAGINIYRDMGWIDSLPKETRDYVNFSLRNQDINDAKNNERYNSLIKKYGGRKIAQDGIYAPRDNTRVRFNNTTRSLDEEELNKLSERNKNIRLDDSLLGFVPIIGDILQGAQGIQDIKDKKYKSGLISLGLLTLPNAIEKPLRNIGKIVKNIKLVGEDGKILNSKIIRKPENFYRSVDKSAILDAKKSGFIRGNFPEQEIHGNPYFARTKEPFNWRKYVIEGNTNSADKWISASRYNHGKIVEVPRKPTIDFSKSYGVAEMSSKEYANYIDNYEVFPMTNGSVNSSPASKFTYWQKYPIFGWRKKNFKYGGIHIKPSKRGTFTAAAKKHGMSVQGFASKVLANKGKYSSTMVKKANFARNASKWKHKEFGGDMDFNYWITKDNIYKLGGRKKGQWGLQDYSNSFLLNNDTLGNIGRMKAIKDMKLGTNSFSDIRVPSFTVAGETFKPKIKDAIVNNNSGLVAQNLANGIQAAINIGGNIGSYFINRNALRGMKGPAAPIPLRAETLPTRVYTGAQEAAIRENIAGQEKLISDNLSSSRSRLNAINRVRNQGIGIYNQLQERKGEIERELITRDKLNRQGITNQNIAQVNQWRNATREFENKRIDLNSENTIQHLIQGPADAIAGEKGFFDNLASNDRYRMTAFLQAITSPDALKAMNSNEIRQLAQKFGVRTSWLRSIGINV